MAWHWTNHLAPVGNSLAGDPSAISVVDASGPVQKPYIFASGDNHLWVNYSDGQSWHWADQGMADAGTFIDATPVAVTVKDPASGAQKPYAFVVTSEGHLRVNYWDGWSWHWADQGHPVGASGGPQGQLPNQKPITLVGNSSAVTVKDTPTSPQRPYAFVVGTDHHLWVNWWSGQSWIWADQGIAGNGIIQSPSAITAMETTTSAQHIYVFAGANDGHLWVNWWNGQSWSWADQGTPADNNLISIPVAITVMDSAVSAQRPYVFVTASDGHLWVNWWSGQGWFWGDQGAPAGRSITGTPSAIAVRTSAAAQHPYVFVTASDGHLWLNWWDGHAWHWTDQGTPDGKAIPGTPSALTLGSSPSSDQQPQVYIVTADGHLWVNWKDALLSLVPTPQP